MNKFLDNRMTIYEYGNPTADVVLIQLVGDHDLHDIENEITEIRNLINKDFRFIVVNQMIIIIIIGLFGQTLRLFIKRLKALFMVRDRYDLFFCK